MKKPFIYFFETGDKVIAVQLREGCDLQEQDVEKLKWLLKAPTFSNRCEGTFVGPRKESITPWSTNAVEITQNMGILSIIRIELFVKVEGEPTFDPMLQQVYIGLNQSSFDVDRKPEPIKHIRNITEYNKSEGLALSPDEISYLKQVSKRIGRPLTNSELFGFSQVNSEHCRHKIFNGVFIIDGEEMEKSLFQMIKETTKEHPGQVVSAYTDNCAFLQGPMIKHFQPSLPGTASEFELKMMESIISLKAETHNFPTTVEPFMGAATGSGGEIRDRMGGGKGSYPLAGSAVYNTSYARLDANRRFENYFPARPWLYQKPVDILIKASNGASDYGNKFGQPLIVGGLLTFEHTEAGRHYGYDKVIMEAGGVGFANKRDVEKGKAKTGDIIVLFGGDNYLIGKGGGSVSSVAGGEYKTEIDLNAVQRANPEMQKRVYDALRAICEQGVNAIISIHDHGAGGHVNCFSELMEETGGKIYIENLPIGDPTLSYEEIIGNESQERMGIIVEETFIPELQAIAERERAPMYVAGVITENMKLIYVDREKEQTPIDLFVEDFFGKPPVTVLEDKGIERSFEPIEYDVDKFEHYLSQVLSLEGVACKDWLTNKVDRSVTGRVAKQQCAGELQLPLNNLGVTTIDYRGERGIAMSIGQAPVAGLISATTGSILSVSRALTNIVWAPILSGLSSVSLSANWMWPAKNPGENARLYEAVQALSLYVQELGINVPTGKDSLSMKQKYPDGMEVQAPGTVIITAAAEVEDVRRIVEPVVQNVEGSSLYYIPFGDHGYSLGGSSFGQTQGKIGEEAPMVSSAEYFALAFDTMQELIKKDVILAGHDVASGGLITTILEMTFANENGGLEIDLSELAGDLVQACFSETPGVLVQVEEHELFEDVMDENGIEYTVIGHPIEEREVHLTKGDDFFNLNIDTYRNAWFYASYLLDAHQSGERWAEKRYENYGYNSLHYQFPNHFEGSLASYELDSERKEKSGIKAAIVREKGINGDREMAYAMYLAGFDVKDVHMTDLISGREDLSDVNYLVFPGGFSNSDVLGSAKGWAGAFKYNEKARVALENFYGREDTMSLGVCNGCQLMIELDLLGLGERNPRMEVNNSGKFESAFLGITIKECPGIMLETLTDSQLGIWVAHGEGKFVFPKETSDEDDVVISYNDYRYPANPNGSDFEAAGLCSDDGRHLAMMPHLERSILPWQWGYYPRDRKEDEVTPWIEAFVNARKWIEEMIAEKE